MAELDTAFKKFKNNPNSKNAWELQKAMVFYSQLFQTPKNKKEENMPKLQTCKSARWESVFQKILDLFSVFNWEVVPFESTEYLESWKVIAADKSEAILYLTYSDGFSMGTGKLNKKLTGEFEGYDDRDRFIEFLDNNSIVHEG